MAYCVNFVSNSTAQWSMMAYQSSTVHNSKTMHQTDTHTNVRCSDNMQFVILGSHSCTAQSCGGQIFYTVSHWRTHVITYHLLCFQFVPERLQLNKLTSNALLFPSALCYCSLWWLGGHTARSEPAAVISKGSLLRKKGKGKVFPYSTPSVGPGADPGVQAVSLQVIHLAVGCHYFPPGPQLPPQPQSITALWPVPSYTAWWQRHIGVDNLPKVVTQHYLEQDLNLRPTDRRPKCLTRCTTVPPLFWGT